MPDSLPMHDKVVLVTGGCMDMLGPGLAGDRHQYARRRGLPGWLIMRIVVLLVISAAAFPEGIVEMIEMGNK